MIETTDSPRQSLPCVVNIGFAGSRKLFDPAFESEVAHGYEAELQHHLREALNEFRNKLGLKEHHFFCGLSQIAVGADFVFARALNSLEQPHRLFLPQPLNQYVEANGSKGPDFSDDESAEALNLAGASNVIQKKVVSHNSNRHERFRETNFEIARCCDIAVCIIQKDSNGKAGGSNEFVELATSLGKPLLLIEISHDDNGLVLSNTWKLSTVPVFQIPSFPKTLEQISFPGEVGKIPDCSVFSRAIKECTSDGAQAERKRFERAAFRIIAYGFFVAAFGTIALAFGTLSSKTAPGGVSIWPKLVVVALAIELVMLIAGWVWKLFSHSSGSVRRWANTRLISAMAKSTSAIAPHRMELRHLLQVSLPTEFLALAKTINVLHLRSSKDNNQPWETSRDNYVNERIAGQISFYKSRATIERQSLNVFELIFWVFAVLSIVAVVGKLYFVLSGADQIAIGILGALAILFPVLALMGPSWAGALDYPARVETFGECAELLNLKKQEIENSKTQPEFEKLVIETERILLGETVNWFSRRANSGI